MIASRGEKNSAEMFKYEIIIYRSNDDEAFVAAKIVLPKKIKDEKAKAMIEELLLPAI